MTNLEFQSACGKRLIDFGLAIENQKIAEALKNRDDELVKQLLDTEF